MKDHEAPRYADPKKVRESMARTLKRFGPMFKRLAEGPTADQERAAQAELDKKFPRK